MVKPIELKGIVRSTSPQNNADGNCEEIINMRLDSGSWRTVGKKATILDNVDYERVYLHKYGTFENFIGVKGGKAIWFASREDGKIVNKNQVICDAGGEVSFNQLNNILLVRSGENIAKAIFRENKYAVSSTKLPDAPVLDVRVWTKKRESLVKTELSYTVASKLEKDNFQEAIANLINQCVEENSGFYEGRVFITATYELFDGSETKPTPPLLVELGSYNKDAIKRENLSWSAGNHQLPVHSGTFWAEMPMGQLSVKVNNVLGEEFKDTVSKINVYATPVYSFYSDKGGLNALGVGTDGLPNPMLSEKNITPEDIEKALFFRVLRIDINDKKHDYTSVKLDDSLPTNKTLRVDASGWQNTVGNMFVYNNRLHLYNIRQRFMEDINLSSCLEQRYQTIETGIHGDKPPVYNYDFTQTRTLKAVFYLKMEQADARIVDDFRVELQSRTFDPQTGRWNNKVRLPRFMAFPDSRAYKVDLYDENSLAISIELEPSDTYNYSFKLFGTTMVSNNRPTTKIGPFVTEIEDNIIEYTDAPAAILPDFNSSPAMDDNMNLVVSEAMNPYYFPVEHSYLMPGEIINLSVNTEQISTSQVGQYPLYVFTTEGIYALQVGDGKVLYSHVIPISAEVAVKGSDVLQTKYGIVFVTKKGLKLIAGSSVTDFSEPVNGHVETQLRESEKFVLINSHQKTFNARPYLSTVSFAEYIRAAEMGYDITEDEIIISNPSYKYSYVFSLKTKTWHKITETFQSINRNLGLQAYTQVTTAATATLRVKSTVAPDGIERYSKVIAFPEMTLPFGTATVYIEYAGLSLPVLTHDVPPEGVPLLELIKKIELPKPLGVFVERENKIYSSILTGIRVRMDEPEDLYFPSVAGVYDVPYEAVGVGERFSITLAGREYSKVTEKTDTTESIVKLIADWVREQGFSVETKNDTLTITALTPGVEGNKIKFTSTPSAHVELNVTGFSGGAESTPKLRVCDIQEETDGVVLAYFQTRPVSLDFFGFKKLTHAAVRGEFKPGGDNQCYFFVFGSNDFTDWSIVMEGSTFKERPNVCMSRAARSYRYFIFFSGGEVLTRKHVFAFAEIEGETVLDERLR